MFEIDVYKLDEMRKSGETHTLLDIREEQELKIASIDGVLHIPMNLIPDQLDRLPTEHPIIVMCHSGVRSSQVTEWLLSQGFENAKNLDGGISAWSSEIDPDVPKY